MRMTTALQCLYCQCCLAYPLKRHTSIILAINVHLLVFVWRGAGCQCVFIGVQCMWIPMPIEYTHPLHQLYQSTNCTAVPAASKHQMHYSTSCITVPAASKHQLLKQYQLHQSTSCIKAPAASQYQLHHSTSCITVPAASRYQLHKQYQLYQSTSCIKAPAAS